MEPRSPFTFESYNQPTQPDPGKQVFKVVLIVIGVILLAYAAFTIISAIITSKTTGILQVTAPAGTTVSATEDGNTYKTLGTGNVKAHLKPGYYQVTATLGNQSSSAFVRIQKQQNTSQQITLTKNIPNQTVGNYSAQNLYAAGDNSLYFVNVPQSLLYNLPLGSTSGRPYETNINPITQAYWESPTQLYGQVGGTWSLYNGTSATAVSYQSDRYVPNSISFNTNGAAAFAANNTPISTDILLINQPGAAPQKLGTIQNINTATTIEQTSVAPDGSVIAFTPVSSFNAPTKPTELFHDGVVTTFPKSLSGIQNVSWSTDSTKFSFTTNTGIFVYDLSQHATTQIFAGTPTDPQSVTWLSGSDLIYPDHNAIWRYQLNSNVSTKLLGFDGLLNVTNPFAIAKDGQTYYFSTVPDSKGKGGKIYQFFPNYSQLPANQQQQANSTQNATAKQAVTSYTGTDDLLSIGVSTDQINSVEYAFGKYFTQTKQSVNTATISNVQSVFRDPNSSSPVTMAYFDVSLDGTKHHCRLDYSGLSTSRLYVYNLDGSQLLFDSGNIDAAQ